MPAARPADVYSLVADIGGTNTRVALAEGPELLSDTITRYRNADHGSLEEVLTAYIAAQGGVDCRAAAVAIAGPVRDGRGTLTNLDWAIDEPTLARAAQAETVAVLNDLQAQGHALGRIAAENLRTVVPGPDAPEGAARLVMGVGTGFNVAPVHMEGAARLVVASEAGHASLPVRTAHDLSLAKFVESAHGFPSVEDVLSGRGLCRIYAWLGAEAGDPREADAATIMQACDDGSDDRAAAAVETFVRLLGAVAGDQALIHLPFGGFYLAGGVARAMTPHLDRFGFAIAFRDKGRFGNFMEDFPVHVIEDDFAALVGCAAYIAQVAASGQKPGVSAP